MERSQPTSRMTLEEFLEFEDQSEGRHEFHDGVVIAMAGSTVDHVSITVNIIAALHQKLKNSPCRPLATDLRLWVKKRKKMYYPDVSVICGEIEYKDGDRSGALVCNPNLIIEVLSPSTESKDRSSKFLAYRDLDSLQEYILVSQKMPQIESFRRGPDGLFVISGTVAGLDSSLQLQSLNINLRLSDVYDRIQFPETDHRDPEW